MNFVSWVSTERLPWRDAVRNPSRNFWRQLAWLGTSSRLKSIFLWSLKPQQKPSVAPCGSKTTVCRGLYPRDSGSSRRWRHHEWEGVVPTLTPLGPESQRQYEFGLCWVRAAETEPCPPICYVERTVRIFALAVLYPPLCYLAFNSILSGRESWVHWGMMGDTQAWSLN